MILYGVMLHLDGYATRFSNVMLCNDDYYMQNANMIGLCGCQARLGFIEVPIKIRLWLCLWEGLDFPTSWSLGTAVVVRQIWIS